MSSTFEFETCVIPDTHEGDMAKQIVKDREKLLKKGFIIGATMAALIAGSYFLFIISILNKYNYQIKHINVQFLIAFIWGMYAIFSSFSFATDRRVLLLRPFNKYDKKQFNLPKQIGNSCRGLAIPFTVQDKSFKNQYPDGSEIFIRNTQVMLSGIIGIYIVLNIRLPTGSLFEFMIFWAGISAVIYYLFYLLIGNIFVHRGNAVNYSKMVEKFFGSKRQIIRFYNGVKVFRFNSDVWKNAIEDAIKSADVIIIDLSKLTENIMWELECAFKYRSPDSIILCWHYGLDEKVEIKGKEKKYEYAKIPSRIADKIEKVVSLDLAKQCQKFSYPQEESALSGMALVFLPAQIAYCMARSGTFRLKEKLS